MPIARKQAVVVAAEVNSADAVTDLIISFLRVNSAPSDEQVHALAEAVGASKEDLEAVIYKMLGNVLLRGDDSILTGKPPAEEESTETAEDDESSEDSESEELDEDDDSDSDSDEDKDDDSDDDKDEKAAVDFSAFELSSDDEDGELDEETAADDDNAECADGPECSHAEHASPEFAPEGTDADDATDTEVDNMLESPTFATMPSADVNQQDLNSGTRPKTDDEAWNSDGAPDRNTTPSVPSV